MKKSIALYFALMVALSNNAFSDIRDPRSAYMGGFSPRAAATPMIQSQIARAGDISGITTGVISENLLAEQTAATESVRPEYLDKYNTYKQNLSVAQSICNSTELRVNNAINAIGTLLGAGIGQIAGGVIGAGVGGANLYFTDQTLNNEKKISELQKQSDDAIAEREKVYKEKVDAAKVSEEQNTKHNELQSAYEKADALYKQKDAELNALKSGFEQSRLLSGGNVSDLEKKYKDASKAVLDKKAEISDKENFLGSKTQSNNILKSVLKSYNDALNAAADQKKKDDAASAVLEGQYNDLVKKVSAQQPIFDAAEAELKKLQGIPNGMVGKSLDGGLAKQCIDLRNGYKDSVNSNYKLNNKTLAELQTESNNLAKILKDALQKAYSDKYNEILNQIKDIDDKIKKAQEQKPNNGGDNNGTEPGTTPFPNFDAVTPKQNVSSGALTPYTIQMGAFCSMGDSTKGAVSVKNKSDSVIKSTVYNFKQSAIDSRVDSRCTAAQGGKMNRVWFANLTATEARDIFNIFNSNSNKAVVGLTTPPWLVTNNDVNSANNNAQQVLDQLEKAVQNQPAVDIQPLIDQKNKLTARLNNLDFVGTEDKLVINDSKAVAASNRYSEICGTNGLALNYSDNDTDGILTIESPACNGGLMKQATDYFRIVDQDSKHCDEMIQEAMDAQISKTLIDGAQAKYNAAKTELDRLKGLRDQTKAAWDKAKKDADDKFNLSIYNAGRSLGLDLDPITGRYSDPNSQLGQKQQGLTDDISKAAQDIQRLNEELKLLMDAESKAKKEFDDAGNSLKSSDDTNASKIQTLGNELLNLRSDSAAKKAALDAVPATEIIDMGQVEADRNTKSDAEIELEKLKNANSSNKDIETGLDIAGIASGLGTGISGGIGLSQSSTMGETLTDTVAQIKTCNNAIATLKISGNILQNFSDENYDVIKDFDEYKTFESVGSAISDMNKNCENAFASETFADIESDLSTAGISSGIALVGGIGTSVSSGIALGSDETKHKQTFRIASTVSSGVSGVSGVVSTVLASKVSKMLAVEKNNHTNCLNALNAVKL